VLSLPKGATASGVLIEYSSVRLQTVSVSTAYRWSVYVHANTVSQPYESTHELQYVFLNSQVITNNIHCRNAYTMLCGSHSNGIRFTLQTLLVPPKWRLISRRLHLSWSIHFCQTSYSLNWSLILSTNQPKHSKGLHECTNDQDILKSSSWWECNQNV